MPIAGVPRAPRTDPNVVAYGSSGLTMEQQSQGGSLRIVLLLGVVVLTVGLATAWAYVVERQIDASVEVAAASDAARAKKVLDAVRARAQGNLRAQCRVMVEDPRLKTALTTEGVDEATVADILRDVGALRGTGFLIVLTPEGRVFAQAGADELRGLDLSGSSVFKAAQNAPEAVVGSWVIRGKTLDLSMASMRLGSSLVGYLAVGQAVDHSDLTPIVQEPVTPSFAGLDWMIRGVPLFMLAAVLLSMIASRRLIVVTRFRRTRV